MTARRQYWCLYIKKRQPFWCPRLILMELSCIHLQTFSFWKTWKLITSVKTSNCSVDFSRVPLKLQIVLCSLSGKSRLVAFIRLVRVWDFSHWLESCYLKEHWPLGTFFNGLAQGSSVIIHLLWTIMFEIRIEKELHSLKTESIAFAVSDFALV